MPELKVIRTSLSVGFPNGELPPHFVSLRGRVSRDIAAAESFPFEDAQFELVVLAAAVVSRASVREAHRVLKPEGRLYFRVDEKKNDGQKGYTLPDIYGMVREGFNIEQAVRPPWWHFGRDGNTLTICARKKNWRAHTGLVRGGAYPLSPFYNA